MVFIFLLALKLYEMIYIKDCINIHVCLFYDLTNKFFLGLNFFSKKFFFFKNPFLLCGVNKAKTQMRIFNAYNNWWWCLRNLNS